MAIHLLPLLLLKVAGKFVAKKAFAHHAAHQSLARKVVNNGAQKVVERVIDKATERKDGRKD
jgi:hypothetical protein